MYTRVFILVLISVVLWSFPVIAVEDMSVTNELTQQIKNRCEYKWPSDYEMREYCQNQQQKAWDRFTILYERYKNQSEILSIFKMCRDKWSDHHGIDFEMLNYCTKKQIEAYNRLH